MIKTILIPALLFLIFSSKIIAQQNVLLIIADDLGTDYCGFYGDAAPDTANMHNIRSLLSRGVRFNNAWASPTCSPTRAGLLTGRYSFRTGVGTAISGTQSAQLDISEITIGKLLKSAAPLTYATANIGKWHLNSQTPQSLSYPNLMGYDHYAGNFLGAIPDYFAWNKVTNGGNAVPVTTYATTETVNDAIAWLDGPGGEQPFFLWLAFNAPHTPFHLPPDSLHNVPGLTGTPMHINQNPKKYFRAMIEAMDTETGRLLDWLEQKGHLDSTNIIFIGDNGNLKRVSQNPDTTQGKGTLYEYGVRVPFIIAGPAVEAPGRVSDALVSTPDLFATILEMAGFAAWQSAIPVAKPVDARSLMPILKNESEAVREWTFSEQFSPVPGPNDGKAIRNLAWKLLHFDDGSQAFFHLETDPGEQSNLLLQPLDAEASSNYDWLCNRLSELIGTNTCDPDLVAVETGPPGGHFEIFPNPAGDFFFLKNGEAAPVEITLFNLTGRVLARAEEAGELVKLDVSRFAAGYFLVQVKHTGGVWRGWGMKG